jgi:hypothetical protein
MTLECANAANDASMVLLMPTMTMPIDGGCTHVRRTHQRRCQCLQQRECSVCIRGTRTVPQMQQRTQCEV